MEKSLPISTGTLGFPFFLILIGALVWVIGGNVVIALQFRRRGMRWDEGFKLGGLLRISLNSREVIALIIIAALAICVVALGTSGLA